MKLADEAALERLLKTTRCRIAGQPVKPAAAPAKGKGRAAQRSALKAEFRRQRSKYGNVPQVVDGLRMASKKEAARYRELGMQLKVGLIDFICRQARFRLPGGIEYVADFLYGKIGSYHWTCEDVKGVKTPAYRMKKKLMLSTHGIEILET